MQQRTRIIEAAADCMRQARLSRRYRLEEVVTFAPRDEPEPVMTGITENVSATGIAFVTETAIDVGSFISLNLYLRSADQERTILLHAEGKVLRVETTATNTKIAAGIRFREDLEEGIVSSRMIQ